RNQETGCSLGEEELAGRESNPKLPRSSQKVSGCSKCTLAGRGNARWASKG
ncbi:hypothetical protein A2U01_0105173, partial [Trifolium medium]|nr:hypothetical protein [Trifolium medium]